MRPIAKGQAKETKHKRMMEEYILKYIYYNNHFKGKQKLRAKRVNKKIVANQENYVLMFYIRISEPRHKIERMG